VTYIFQASPYFLHITKKKNLRHHRRNLDTPRYLSRFRAQVRKKNLTGQNNNEQPHFCQIKKIIFCKSF